ncbi:MAG TPA: CHC2 zinc finger domain-containing protein [Bacillota bacterium]|nr:CHC2 zinc finger domain-containing protein [Bacillota bacterium]
MARIPDIEIERIKRETSVLELAQSRGITFKKHGADYIGLCPFHDDHEPSLVITPETNLWRCFGACNTGGSVIDFLMKLENISFRHAAEKLLGAPELPLTTENLDRRKLLNQVTEFYHQTLYRDPAALEYLAKRGIRSEEALQTFKIGYANRTLNYAISDPIREELKTVGILRESGHEHFAGSVVIPILDENGATLEMYGRKVLSNLRKGTPHHLYLPGPHQGVWNLSAFKASKEIILCEALIDALTFWVNGLRNVTSSFGVSGFTPDLMDSFNHFAIEKVYIAYDNDPAGNQAALALAPKFAAAGIDVYRVNFPQGLDANAFALKTKDPAATLRELLEQATPIRLAAQQTAATAAGVTSLAAVPSAPASDLSATIGENEITVTISDRVYRIRGLAKHPSPETLKINLRISYRDRLYIDNLDLYSAKHRGQFLTGAIRETGLSEDILRADLARLLLKLEELQQELIASQSPGKERAYRMTPEEEQEALTALKQPDLIQRILADFAAAGTVGEETNKLIGYLAAISRKLDDPLAVIFMSRSAAGKSSLQDAILSFVPDEDKVKYTAITGQSLFYLEENALVHKVLAIAEDEGAERANYAIKTMQSDKNLTIASTGKDPATGKMRTQEYQVKGPIAIMLTTTAAEIDYETASRFLILTVDEDREQTRQIHDRQRENETLAGMLGKLEAEAVIKRQQNLQRALKPILVVNPYAPHLTFLADRLRTRRDHKKYLGLIRAIAFLHQYQRPKKTVTHQGQKIEYIEATLADIDLANKLANEVLGHSLDEMAPATRRLLNLIWRMVEERMKQQESKQGDCLFSRRELREATGWGNTQLHVHLNQLIELEYLAIRTGKNGQRHFYELLYHGEGQAGEKFLLGLLDTKQLKQKLRQNLSAIKTNLSESKTDLSAPIQAPFGQLSDGENNPETKESSAITAT